MFILPLTLYLVLCAIVPLLSLDWFTSCRSFELYPMVIEQVLKTTLALPRKTTTTKATTASFRLARSTHTCCLFPLYSLQNATNFNFKLFFRLYTWPTKQVFCLYLRRILDKESF